MTAFERDCGPYATLGLQWDMVYGPNSEVHLVLKVGTQQGAVQPVKRANLAAEAY